ncbi:MAG TPA: DUF6445 family protein [Sphingomonas sp.]|jgi:hypothetical protein
MRLESGASERAISVLRVGLEEQPVVIIDGFAPDPDTLRATAAGERFGSAAHHYPGIRAQLPATYFQPASALLADVLGDVFGHYNRVDVVDASFSIVTTPPAELSVRQRLPHCDAFALGRIALLHYLAPDDGTGTAFFRHRSTGFETIDESRAATYLETLDAQLRGGPGPPPRYIADDTDLFQRTALVQARYNRALLYRSFVLHSGAIAADAILSPDPSVGRLTVTAFLAAS